MNYFTYKEKTILKYSFTKNMNKNDAKKRNIMHRQMISA